jgi:hypothetical protein
LYFTNSGYGSLRPAGTLPGAGTSTSNSTFEQHTNPNYGGNGTTFFVAPTYVAGPAFPAATTAAPTPGIQRDTLNGPGYNDVDATLSKAFGLPRIRGLGENAKFEIRADAYNLFNKTNLNTGCIDTYLGQANPNGTLNGTPNGDFGVIGCALGSRTVQLQARFSF